MDEVQVDTPVPHYSQALVDVKKYYALHNVATAFDVQVLAPVPQIEQTPSFIK